MTSKPPRPWPNTAVALCGGPPPHLLTIRAAREVAALDPDPARAEAVLVDIAEHCRQIGSHERLLQLIDTELDRPPLRRVDSPTASVGAPTLVEPLTEREMDILRLLKSNLSYPEIGNELYISRHTVKTHVVHIYRKLGVPSRSAAVKEARRVGLLNAAAGA